MNILDNLFREQRKTLTIVSRLVELISNERNDLLPTKCFTYFYTEICTYLF